MIGTVTSELANGGDVADIVIFDPETVTDMSDYLPGKNGLVPKGMPHVLVAGKFVKKNGKATNLMAGAPIRFELTESKWQPVKVKQIR